MRKGFKFMTAAAAALLALAITACGSGNSESGGSKSSGAAITVFTTFPTGTTTDSRVDITYEAKAGAGATVDEVYYRTNGGAPEYIYLSGADGLSPKGALGTARVMLVPGQNSIVFTMNDSAGNTAACTIPNRPVYDFGTSPEYKEETLVPMADEGNVWFVSNRIIAFAARDVTQAQVGEAIATIGGRIVGQTNAIRMYWVELPGSHSEASLRNICENLMSSHPNVFEVVSFDTVNEFAAPQSYKYTNDPQWETDDGWNLIAINAPSVWSTYGSQLKDIKIGVIDDGFFIDHEDLQLNKDHVVNGIRADKDHGTHVMGIIGAIHNNGKGLSGVMDIKNRDSLYGYDPFLWRDIIVSPGQFPDARVISGLVWNVTNGAKVINVSLGIKGEIKTDLFRDMNIKFMYEQAMTNLFIDGYDYLVVHSAGNDNIDAKRKGCFAYVTDGELRKRIIIVGAVDRSNQMAYFSNWGDMVEVVAPGVGIFSTRSISDSDYGYYGRKQGTSQAAPHITGLAGLVWSANPGLPSTLVKRIIVEITKEHGKPIAETRLDAQQPMTYYMPNAMAAVSWAMGVPYFPVTNVALNKKETTIAKGSSEQLTYTIQPANATSKYVIWESDAPQVATVKDGLVTAHQVGIAYIDIGTADGNFTDTCFVTVTPSFAVTVSPKTVTLPINGTQEFSASADDTNITNNGITWTATGGTIQPTWGGPLWPSWGGKALYTAPGTAGTYIVRATSDGDPSKWDEATVTVTPPGDGTVDAWASVSAGAYHTMAIRTDGSLWAWGSNGSGQLGLGDYTSRNTPTRVGTDNNWASVSARYEHTMAIRADGSLWAWGKDIHCELGLGDNAYNYKISPTRVGMDNDWASVSAGYEHTMAIRTDGSLWAWGHNNEGQSGPSGSTYITSPSRVGTDNNWASVSAGLFHTMAIRTDGSLWACGRNSDGQLGMGDLITKFTLTRVGTDNNWASVSAGYDHTMAIRRDGSLWAWGSNIESKLGLDVSAFRVTTPTLVGTENNWAIVSAGGEHTFATKRDGSLWAWGNNAVGQLGLGDLMTRYTPTRVGSDNNWAHVSASFFHTMAVRSDGGLWAWGYNSSGQLGLGDTVDRNVPTRVGPSTGAEAPLLDDSQKHDAPIVGDMFVPAPDHTRPAGLGGYIQHSPVFVVD